MATIQDVMYRVREQISDDVPDATGAYRWADVLLFRLIEDGIRDVCGSNPEALCLTEVTTDDVASVTALTQALQVRNEYITAVVDYTSSRVQKADGEDLSNRVLSIDSMKESEAQRED